MKEMEIKQRGKGPYQVWSGPLIDDGKTIISQFPEGHRHQETTYFDALRQVFSLSESGKRSGPYICDDEGNKVFDTTNEADRELLAEIDRVTFLYVIVTSS